MGNHRAEKRPSFSRPRGRVTTGDAGPSSIDGVPGPHQTADKTAVSSGGKRRAEKPSTGVPMVPTLAGVTVLGLAGSAAGMDSGMDVDFAQATDTKLAMSSIDAKAIADLDERAKVISRDSEREALEQASDLELQKAADDQAAARQKELAKLGERAEERSEEIAEDRWVLPVAGYRITARFGMYGLWSRGHTGLDFAGPYGSTLYAVANGTITSTGYDGAYGNKTVLELEDGTEIWYCHQSSVNVSVGESVTGGEAIGNTGMTGRTTGPHLHLEVRPGGGNPVDPAGALAEHGVTP